MKSPAKSKTFYLTAYKEGKRVFNFFQKRMRNTDIFKLLNRKIIFKSVEKEKVKKVTVTC